MTRRAFVSLPILFDVPMLTASELFTQAVGEHRVGRLAEASVLYEEVLAIDTSHAGAMHYLGVIAHQRDEHHSAVEWIQRSLDTNPGNAAAHSNLGTGIGRSGAIPGSNHSV
jgi:Tfp pilus assembly protein PilF